MVFWLIVIFKNHYFLVLEVASIDSKVMKEIVIRLPVCISKTLGVLSREELSMKVHLVEGFRLLPLLYNPQVRQGDFNSIARRLRYDVCFVNWALSNGYYSGDLSKYFRKKINNIREAESLVL